MTPEERQLIDRLLSPSFRGRDRLVEQLADAKVRQIDDDHGLEFLVSTDSSLEAVKYGVPTEGEYEDPDGTTVHVLLHVMGNIAYELEFYREDGAMVRSWPDLALLRVFAP